MGWEKTILLGQDVVDVIRFLLGLFFVFRAKRFKLTNIVTGSEYIDKRRHYTFNRVHLHLMLLPGSGLLPSYRMVWIDKRQSILHGLP